MGDATKIDGEASVVHDSPDKYVRLHVDKKSKRDGTFDAGDNSLGDTAAEARARGIGPIPFQRIGAEFIFHVVFRDGPHW